MKIYKVGYRDDWDEHTGYEYFSNKMDAKRAFKKGNTKQWQVDFQIIEDIKISKDGIIDALNQYASHPDNG